MGVYTRMALYSSRSFRNAGSFLTSTPKKINCSTNIESRSQVSTSGQVPKKVNCRRNILENAPSIVDLESGRKLRKRMKRPESYTVELDESVCSDHAPTE